VAIHPSIIELQLTPNHRWVDADSIIVNPAISPCAFLPPDTIDNVYALVTADHNGLNNGIFYLKVHPSSLDLLTNTIAYPLVHPEEDLGWFGEQAAMAHVINATESRHESAGTLSGIAWVPRDWFNNYEFEHGFEGKPGSFLVHFAGLAETRLQHMANWLAELGQNQAKWEIPIEDTPYRDSIPEFWTKYAESSTGRTWAL
jgi:hypothetical protein